ncbi:hypothetical protein D3C78_1438940 [compost metagenome]
MRLVSGKLSLIPHKVMPVKNMPKSPRKINTPIHDVNVVTALPAVGEIKGATLLIIVSSAMNLTISTPLY